MIEKIKNDAEVAIKELIEISGISEGDILVIGCSSSEMIGGTIGKSSAPEAAEALLDAIYPILQEKEIFLAAGSSGSGEREAVLPVGPILPATKRGLLSFAAYLLAQARAIWAPALFIS